MHLIPPTQWLIDTTCVLSSCFILYPISGIAMEISFSNDVSIGNGGFLCYPILLNNALDYMVCLIDADSIFNLYNSDIWELDIGNFLECVVKEVVKFLSQSPKPEYMLCGHDYVICI